MLKKVSKQKMIQFKFQEEEFADIVSRSRDTIYHEANILERTIQIYLDKMASKKITSEIYFAPSKGTARVRQVRTVYFNTPLKILDPDGTIEAPYLTVSKLMDMPADRSAGVEREWALIDSWEHVMYMRDLATDDLFFLVDRLTDPDCSLQPGWIEKGLQPGWIEEVKR